jgi:hypothetical protein
MWGMPVWGWIVIAVLVLIILALVWFLWTIGSAFVSAFTRR